MEIRAIDLLNIRSYTSHCIEFPSGSVLLSGDIGAGKSTILLAIEFALFGIRKPDLTGSTLLRNGEKKGSVMLNVMIDNKEVIVKRTLRRSKTDIKQESGFIIVDGIKEEGTPVELKARILSLLGYPTDLVSKHKDLVYRYTVYTPQEEMKSIILDKGDSRLNTLRKVFGIDKYKRIRENALIFKRSIKDEIQELKGKTYDLKEKEKIIDERKNERVQAEKERNVLLPKIQVVTKVLKETAAELKELEVELEKQRVIERKIESLSSEARSLFEERVRSKKIVEQQTKEIVTIKDSIKDVSYEDGTCERLQDEIEGLRNKSDDLLRLASRLDEKIRSSTETMDSIIRLNNCPTCEQDVSEEHKSEIRMREEARIAKFSAQKEESRKELEELKEKISGLKITIEAESKKMQQKALILAAKKNLEQKEKLLNSLLDSESSVKKRMAEINLEKEELKKKIKKVEGYESLKTRHQKLIGNDKELAVEEAKVSRSIENLSKEIQKLDEDIKEKKAYKSKLNELSNVEHWIDEYFINLMGLMEKHVMSRLYREFNENFIVWFNSLVEDETMSSRLDEEFSPLITQNGYDIDIENLSGGEKTAVALAYRLSLNKVINDYISNIKTKDLIILDEPTDGFSDEQLDRVRDVLENLDISQVIIVSHETKIESFVDNVIRIEKDNHVSTSS